MKARFASPLRSWSNSMAMTWRYVSITPVTKMPRLYLCMSPRSRWTTAAAAYSGGGSFESVVLYVYCHCMLAGLYVSVRVNPFWYGSEVFIVPHFHITQLRCTSENDLVSDNDCLKIRQSLLNVSSLLQPLHPLFHLPLSPHGPK